MRIAFFYQAYAIIGSREVNIPSQMSVLREPQREDLLRCRKRHFITRNTHPLDPDQSYISIIRKLLPYQYYEVK